MDRDCIISAAYGVGPDYVLTMLRSFRAVNADADIVLLAWSSEGLSAVCRRYGARIHLDRWISRSVPRPRLTYTKRDGKRTTKRVRLTEILSRVLPAGRWVSPWLPEGLLRPLVSVFILRHFHAREALKSTPYRSVMLTDCRDVLFQRDPFATRPRLVFAQERTRFGDGTGNDIWIRDGFGQERFDRLNGRQIFCAGTTLGAYGAILHHLEMICEQSLCLRTWRWGGIDQAIHNWLIYNRYTPDQYDVSTNDRGLIATIATDANCRLVGGEVVDVDGSAYPIVHQYDRLPPDVVSSLRALNTGTEHVTAGV